MAGKRRGKRAPARLDASFAGAIPETVPTRWVKFVVGIFLLPPAWVLTQTFFTAFARTTLRDMFWLTEEFWFFALGALIWLVAFFTLPQQLWKGALWLYVFGHEMTHALWAVMMGGRVHNKFHVTTTGGHILTNKTNTWIALAPYFFPIYSLLAISLYGVAALFADVSPLRQVLFAALGFTWAFHLSFTCWMIPKGQPDLSYGGQFFSVVLIYMLNLLLLVALLIIASPKVTCLGFLRELLKNAADFSHHIVRLASKI